MELEIVSVKVLEPQLELEDLLPKYVRHCEGFPPLDRSWAPHPPPTTRHL